MVERFKIPVAAVSQCVDDCSFYSGSPSHKRRLREKFQYTEEGVDLSKVEDDRTTSQ